MIIYNGDDITHLIGNKELDRRGTPSMDRLVSEISSIHFSTLPKTDGPSKDRKIHTTTIDFYGKDFAHCKCLDYPSELRIGINNQLRNSTNSMINKDCKILIIKDSL